MWSSLNTYNQHAARVTIPANSAITQLFVKACGYSSSVSTRLVLWSNGGSALKQSSTFTMAYGGTTPASHTKDISSYVVSSETTFMVGLYRNPSGSHLMRVKSGGDGYRKTNTSSFPNVASMSGYATDSDDEPYVGAFYISKPATPTSVTRTRVSDTQFTIAWSKSSTTDAPITSIKVERWNNVTGTWSQIASLGNVSSYTDTGTIANRSYKWRVRAYNDAGYSSYATETAVYKTTPANPTNVVAVRSGSNVNITWTRNDTTADNYIVERSVDGGAYAELTGALSGTATSYQDTSPGTLNVYKIKAEVSSPTTLASTGTISNSVQTLSAPDAPTNLLPATIIDYAIANTFTWQHNTTDTSEQSKFSLEYDTADTFDVDPQLISEEVSTDEFHEFAAETFVDGTTYYWRVKTWGAYATGSAWSATQSFTAVSKPVPAITVPENEGTYGYSELTVEWDYTDSNSYDQTNYTLTLFDSDDNVLEQLTGISSISTGESDSKTFAYALENETSYYVTLTVQNSVDLLSEEVISSFTTDFDPPPTPTLTVTDNEDGTITLTIENPAAGEGEEETFYNRIYRKVADEWELIFDNVEVDTNIIDYLPLINGTTYYYVEAVSTVPSIAESTEEEVTTSLLGVFILNSGSDYSDMITLFGDISFGEDYDKEQELINFAGRAYPVRFEGEHKTRVINLSAYLSFDEYNTYLNLIDNQTDCWYRDWHSRWFKCAISGSKINKKETFGYQVSMTITRID